MMIMKGANPDRNAGLAPSRVTRLKGMLLARLLGTPRCVTACAAMSIGLSFAQTVVTEMDPGETVGQRPYEMTWANRAEFSPPSVEFDKLDGWHVKVEGGAQAVLQISRAQTVWNRPVARLRYHGDGNASSQPRVLLTPPQPVSLPKTANSLDMWAYGNRWGWENPPGTPPVRIVLHLRTAKGESQTLHVADVNWQEWWMAHKRLPPKLLEPAFLDAVEISGGWQAEWREIYLDSIRFYAEELTRPKFATLPRRNITLLDGQTPGANTGSGRLPFPTREETILPMHFGGRFTNGTATATGGFHFWYQGADTRIDFRFNATAGLPSLRAELNGQTAGLLLDGARVLFDDRRTNSTLLEAHLDRGVVRACYDDGTELRVRIWQKSLVIDLINQSGRATGFDCGQSSELVEPRTIWVPYLTYGNGPHPCVLLSRAGGSHFFASIWLDWYRSNGSEPYAAESASTNTARINGGVRYHPRTDGHRNPLFERLFVTVSPRFEETLPVIPNPVGLHASEAVDRLWQESWGPDDYEKQKKRCRMLRAYGIEKLIQCNHEIAWRDGGESFTLRLRAAPKKGGDPALQDYISHQRALGWLAGLYSNYTDYAPVNEFWDPDGVQREPDGNWRSAWPRCWALKPLKAVEFDRVLAPRIKKKFGPTSAYTDVHTAVAPWHYNDYDARVPGAGTFAQTIYAYGELLRNDSRVYGSPIFSEGTYHWLYAGLADGNYALAYDGRPLAKEPLLPAFDLYQIHPKECDIGIGWTANFCDAIPDWRTPANLDRAIDRFLLHTLAYGHIGWLVEEDHGITRTCRSYYMLQQVQARYGLKTPNRIAYWDGGRLTDLSEAIVRDLPQLRRQLYVEYPGGLRLWLNDHPQENWTVNLRRTAVTLPPAGWAAESDKEDLLSYSALDGTNRVDYLRSEAYIYQDGRGAQLSTPEAVSDGALAIFPRKGDTLDVIRISGSGSLVVRPARGIKGVLKELTAYDVEGKQLAVPNYTVTNDGVRIEQKQGAIRYALRFGGAKR